MREEQKAAAASAALEFLKDGMAVGFGTGSTAERFIECVIPHKQKIKIARASSERTAKLLAEAGIKCNEDISELDLYVDGADEIDGNKQLIKGGGGAHTREKILANCARQFVCIADGSKLVKRLGKFPLPVEVLPQARSLVARKLAAMGGSPEWREGFVTDNGNWILDVRGLDLTDAAQKEMEICALPGVVDCGIFAKRPADVALIADEKGVNKI